jgi:UDP-N-acetyl-2-amino-2-deoxyglucuronate dehydrogenase
MDKRHGYIFHFLRLLSLFSATLAYLCQTLEVTAYILVVMFKALVAGCISVVSSRLESTTKSWRARAISNQSCGGSVVTYFAGIVGAGNISDTHARAVRSLPGVEIAAIAGRNLARAQELVRQFGGRAYGDFQDFLAHRPMDLVIIGSPSGLHAEQGIAAARRGLHVLVEKPIDINIERADALISCCEKAGVKLGVIFQDRTKPDIRMLKNLIISGAMGKPNLVTARVKWYRPPEYYSTSHWRGTWALDGGGALMNQGIHTVDLLLWLMGDVTRVYACAVTALHEIEAEDTVVATLEFASGAVGTLEATTAAFPGYDRRVEITGSEGTVILDRDKVISVDLIKPVSDFLSSEQKDNNASASSPVVSDIRGHGAVIEDFVKAIGTGANPLCNGFEGRRSVAVVRAIYDSSQTGQPVTVQPST